MATMIIGASSDPEPGSGLPTPDVDLPAPNSAPAGKRRLDDARIAQLLAHENPLMRAYALEQIGERSAGDWEGALTSLIADEDLLVAVEAITLIEKRKITSAVDALLGQFKEAQGPLAATIGGALGELAPDRLLAAVRERPRLDDEAFAATATALAIIGSEEVVAYLDKALNRAGTLGPERKGALYGAALLSGSAELAGRVVGLAIDDSKDKEPENASFPTRAALAALTGIPLPYSRHDAGLEILDQARDLIEMEVPPQLSDAEAEVLQAALKQKDAAAIIGALEPILSRDAEELASGERDDVAAELGTMPVRRKGLLRALVDRNELIGALDLPAAGLFVAAAAKACSLIVASEAGEATSEAIVALAKAVEGDKSPEALASMTEEELTDFFREKSPRLMRAPLSVMVREPFRRGRTLERFARALIKADHGRALLDACAEVERSHVHDALVRAFGACREESEALLLEVFEERPLEPQVGAVALSVAEEIRTERIALSLGRNFFRLRDDHRSGLARAILRTGDERLLPILESRAFADEPEEVAWVVLSLVHEQPIEGKLAEAIDRTMDSRIGSGPGAGIRLPLACDRCNEVGVYEYERVFLDVEAKDALGDPAFVGEIRCKACDATDTLTPTEDAARILTAHMMEFLQLAQSGHAMGSPLVSPAQTQIGAARVGLAEGLRRLDRQVEDTPEAIRPRLHRARLRLMLKRNGIQEDLSKVFELDKDCIEARALRASLFNREGRHQEAAEAAAEAVQLLSVESPRLYDADDPARFKESLEELLVELERSGAKAPESMDLDAAKTRIAAREIDRQIRHEAQRKPQQEPPAPAQQALPPEAFKNVGRNDPCPCGSGAKFKKCHGKR